MSARHCITCTCTDKPRVKPDMSHIVGTCARCGCVLYRTHLDCWHPGRVAEWCRPTREDWRKEAVTP